VSALTEKHPSGAKARADFELFMARLKSCPFKAAARMAFQTCLSAALKARADFEALAVWLKSCPFAHLRRDRVSRQAHKSCPFKAPLHWGRA
jgi:hypothetical protein